MTDLRCATERAGLLEAFSEQQTQHHLTHKAVGLTISVAGVIALVAFVSFRPSPDEVAEVSKAAQEISYAEASSTVEGGATSIRPRPWHWHSGIQEMKTSAGFTWYTRIFSLVQEKEPVGSLQMGMAGTWLSPTNIDFDTCVCDPKGWPSARKDDQAFGCCDENSCGWLYQTIEGGPGYWPSAQLPTKMVRWRIVATAGCYTGGAQLPLFWYGGQRVDCEKMGVIQLSNRVLLAPDGITFARQGLFGVGFVRTPLGKTSAGDDRSFWALVVDTDGFSGPIAYFLPEMWAERQSAVAAESAHLADWGHHAVGMSSGGGFGFEWAVSETLAEAGVHKIPKMAVPANAAEAGTSVLAAGARGYENSDIYDQLEEALSRKQPLKAENLMANGQPLTCDTHDEAAPYRVTNQRQVSLGRVRTESTGDGCTWSLLTQNKSGSFPQYFRASDLSPVEESAAPAELREAKFEEWKNGVVYDAVMMTRASGSCGYKANTRVGAVAKETVSFLGIDAGWHACCARCKAGSDADPPCVAWQFNHDGYCYSKFDNTGAATQVPLDHSSNSDAGIILSATQGCSDCGHREGENVGWTGREETLQAKSWKECCDHCKAKAAAEVPCVAWVYQEQDTVCWLKLQGGKKASFMGERKEGMSAGILLANANSAELANVRCSTEDACAAEPGPAEDALHCLQTSSPSWIAYRWYRFVDQPGLQHLKLTHEQKQFMQARVEWLHGQLTGQDGWMKAPSLGGEPLVQLDKAQFVEPPVQMSKGYVPIAVYEGLEKPAGCSSGSSSTPAEGKD